MTKALLIAAPMSGSGKTSLCRGLVAALAGGAAGESLKVQTFKLGPDYLDPLHLEAASGLTCHNLDPWMMGEGACRELFARHTTQAAAQPDVAVVEGAMGLFDGSDPASNAGSSAGLAKLLNIPVVLVVDVAGQGRSVAALVKGFLEFDPSLRVAGVILNRAGSRNHADLVVTALAEALPQVPVFGCLPTQAGLDLPGRHLGLQPPGNEAEDKTRDLARWVGEHVDFAALLDALPDLPPAAATLGQEQAQVAREQTPEKYKQPAAAIALAPKFTRPRIAVSRDTALFFLYQENLDLLRAAGADLVFFSPLADAALPVGCCGLYLCGGYPELYAGELSANRSMLDSVRGFIGQGGPVYAECGGYMYLMSSLETVAGENYPLVGHFPWACRMETRRQALGYREVCSLVSSCLGPAGLQARGHVFHYSSAAEPLLDFESVPEAAPNVTARPVRLFSAANAVARPMPPLGVLSGSVAAAYAHLHFASNPDLSHNFVETCASFGACL